MTFNEDQSRLRIGHGAKNMAVIRHFALNLVRQVADKQSINRRRKRAWKAASSATRIEDRRTEDRNAESGKSRFETDWLPGHIGLELRCAK